MSYENLPAKLYEMCRAAVAKVAGRGQFEEALAEAHLAMLAAVKTFDPSKGGSLATWVYRLAYCAALRVCGRDRSRSAHRWRRLSQWDGESGVPTSRLRKNARGHEAAVDDRDEVDRMLSWLPAEEAAAFRLRHGEGLHHTEVARRMGVKKIRAWRLVRRATARLRRAVGEAG